MNPLNYGDWSKLTDWLLRQKGDIVKVTDDELAQIGNVANSGMTLMGTEKLLQAT